VFLRNFLLRDKQSYSEDSCRKMGFQTAVSELSVGTTRRSHGVPAQVPECDGNLGHFVRGRASGQLWE
jgi:hypothetical protein